LHVHAALPADAAASRGHAWQFVDAGTEKVLAPQALHEAAVGELL